MSDLEEVPESLLEELEELNREIARAAEANL